MVGLSLGVVQDAIAGSADLQAQIHIIEGHSQILRKAADLLKNRAAYHQAGRRHGAELLGTPVLGHIPAVIAGLTHKGMAGHAAQSYDHTGMLHRIVSVIEPGAHNADLRPHTGIQKRLHAVVGYHFQVIV